tara:strand:- start:200 stop:472 length:273 start_codon:yes stop_codon:yes gene_type:complete
MASEPLDAQVSARICKHMNDEHHEALIEFAKSYGGISHPKKVKMINLTPLAIKLDADGEQVEIAFDHELINSSDAHHSLVSMLKRIKGTS